MIPGGNIIDIPQWPPADAAQRQPEGEWQIVTDLRDMAFCLGLLARSLGCDSNRMILPVLGGALSGFLLGFGVLKFLAEFGVAAHLALDASFLLACMSLGVCFSIYCMLIHPRQDRIYDPQQNAAHVHMV